VAPRSNEPYFAKRFAVLRVSVSAGCQRAPAEFATISADAGRHVADVVDVPPAPQAIVEFDPV